MNAFIHMSIDLDGGQSSRLGSRVEDDTAFCPDKGYPRLIRYDLPDDGTGRVAELEPEFNLLRVQRRLYDSCNDMEQHIVLKTMKPRLYMTDLINLRG